SILALLTAAALVPAPASGNSITTRDRPGGKGPISLAKLQTGHVRLITGPVSALTITFDRPIRPRQWGPRDFVVVAVDTDRKPKDDYWYYVFAGGGRLYTSAYSPHTRSFSYYDQPRLKRISGRSIRLTMDGLSDFEGHFYAVGSFRKDGGVCRPHCWDTIPNRGYLVHDHVPPSFSLVSRPLWALRDTVPVKWRITDRGLAGVRRSTLFATDLETRKWRRVATNPTARKHVREVRRAPEGTSMLFRITAEDWNGHRVDSGTFGTSVPYDQENADGNPLYAGLWLETEDPAAYGGTVRASTTTADRFMFSGEGDQFCVFFRPFEGEMSFALDGGGGTTGGTWGNFGKGRHLVCAWAEYGTHTAEVKVTSGRVMVDAYWFGRSPESAAAQMDEAPPRLAPAGAGPGTGGLELPEVIAPVSRS
ncbi:MAG: hypothetical protein M3279_02555, partial [Actinomycetota bacterium]|nr:hypothetical protein [Actinomycetota bacterium]